MLIDVKHLEESLANSAQRVLTAIIFSSFTQTLSQSQLRTEVYLSGEGSGWHIVIRALLALQIFFKNFMCVVPSDSKSYMCSV